MSLIIHVPKRELIVNPKTECPIGGRYHSFTLTKVGADGRPMRGTTRPAMVRSLVGEMRPAGISHNLLTNYGMNAFATAGLYDQLFGFCRVGTGSATPAFTDLALATHRAASNSAPSVGDAWAIRREISTPPFYYEMDVRRSFAAGAASGNLTEIGMSAAPAGNTLCSRALITDIHGAPATLTVAADEILEVTYTWRVYIPTSDVTGTTSIKSTSYDWTMRPCAIHQHPSFEYGKAGWPYAWNVISLAAFYGPRAYCVGPVDASSGNATSAVSTATALGAMNTQPITASSTPSARQISAQIPQTYVANSFYLETTFEWGLDRGNHAALGLWQFQTGFGAFQLCLDGDTVSKANTERMRMVLGLSWARA